MYAYPVENQILENIRKLLTPEQADHLFYGAHYLIVDDGALFTQWKKLGHLKQDQSHQEAFVINGMGNGDISVQLEKVLDEPSKYKYATLLFVKPHLPREPHFIKAWVFKLIEMLFSISFGPQGFCRYTKDRPFIINLTPSECPSKQSRSKKKPAASQTCKNLYHATFLPTYEKQTLAKFIQSDHRDFEQTQHKTAASNRPTKK